MSFFHPTTLAYTHNRCDLLSPRFAFSIVAVLFIEEGVEYVPELRDAHRTGRRQISERTSLLVERRKSLVSKIRVPDIPKEILDFLKRQGLNKVAVVDAISREARRIKEF